MADTEKITINLSAVDLGRIDLLAEEGFYSNRTDFIRTAIRKEIDAHKDVVEKSVTRRASALGLVVYNRQRLEESAKKHERLAINVVGGVHLTRDVTPDLARRTIQSVKVHGVFRASQAVKDALADRML
jgi:metal-responsive CopG/Arc/MetJ family transcriptional regulator